ncbi:MAG: hypothetical protein ACLQBK_10150 [Candidatus Sulfotelmatobacter sp.]
MLTTVAWSSAFDSRLVEAGGTLVNLAAALVFWIALRSAKHASMPTRYGVVRYVGIPRHQQGRLRKLTMVPYLSAILLASVAGLLNPLGIQLLWHSALPATAGGQSGLLWLQYYIPRQTEPKRSPGQLARSYVWIGVAVVLGVVYVVVLGRGVTLRS